MRFAVKKLTRSDLTFFEYQFRRQNAGNQKSINLNADVFIDDIFPYARTVAAGLPHQFPVRLQIFGPGLLRTPDNKMRKVIAAGGNQKNWRLNGEFVPDPDDDPTRYHGLAAGDLAVFAFEVSLTKPVPESIALVLVSQAELDDARVLTDLQAFLGTGRMAVLPADVLAKVSATSPADHPIRELLDIEMDVALEEAALGSIDAIGKLRTRPSARRMTTEALAKARARAEINGLAGECLINIHLQHALADGRIRSFRWVSEENAISPWDFEVVDASGLPVRVEVKSTSGGFDRPIHISQNEVLAAADPAAPRTDLYRVFALSDDGGWLRISPGIASICQSIACTTTALGAGISPDGYSVDVARLAGWSELKRLINGEFDEGD
jgi:Domain of unknown function (DUF3883)